MNSDEILEVVNDLTLIHNNIMENHMFCAGSNLMSLQFRLIGKMELEIEEELKMKDDIKEKEES